MDEGGFPAAMMGGGGGRGGGERGGSFGERGGWATPGGRGGGVGGMSCGMGGMGSLGGNQMAQMIPMMEQTFLRGGMSGDGRMAMGGASWGGSRWDGPSGRGGGWDRARGWGGGTGRGDLTGCGGWGGETGVDLGLNMGYGNDGPGPFAPEVSYFTYPNKKHKTANSSTCPAPARGDVKAKIEKVKKLQAKESANIGKKDKKKKEKPVLEQLFASRTTKKAKLEYECKWHKKTVKNWVGRDLLIQMGYKKMVCSFDDKKASAAKKIKQQTVNAKKTQAVHPCQTLERLCARKRIKGNNQYLCQWKGKKRRTTWVKCDRLEQMGYQQKMAEFDVKLEKEEAETQRKRAEMRETRERNARKREAEREEKRRRRKLSQEEALAFAMCTHSRLGGESVCAFSQLTTDLVQKIVGVIDGGCPCPKGDGSEYWCMACCSAERQESRRRRRTLSQEETLAFAMCTHSRLGGEPVCAFSQLTTDLVKMIVTDTERDVASSEEEPTIVFEWEDDYYDDEWVYGHYGFFSTLDDRMYDRHGHGYH